MHTQQLSILVMLHLYMLLFIFFNFYYIHFQINVLLFHKLTLCSKIYATGAHSLWREMAESNTRALPLLTLPRNSLKDSSVPQLSTVESLRVGILGNNIRSVPDKNSVPPLDHVDSAPSTIEECGSCTESKMGPSKNISIHVDTHSNDRGKNVLTSEIGVIQVRHTDLHYNHPHPELHQGTTRTCCISGGVTELNEYCIDDDWNTSVIYPGVCYKHNQPPLTDEVLPCLASNIVGLFLPSSGREAGDGFATKPVSENSGDRGSTPTHAGSDYPDDVTKPSTKNNYSIPVVTPSYLGIKTMVLPDTDSPKDLNTTTPEMLTPRTCGNMSSGNCGFSSRLPLHIYPPSCPPHPAGIACASSHVSYSPALRCASVTTPIDITHPSDVTTSYNLAGGKSILLQDKTPSDNFFLSVVDIAGSTDFSIPIRKVTAPLDTLVNISLKVPITGQSPSVYSNNGYTAPVVVQERISSYYSRLLDGDPPTVKVKNAMHDVATSSQNLYGVTTSSTMKSLNPLESAFDFFPASSPFDDGKYVNIPRVFDSRGLFFDSNPCSVEPRRYVGDEELLIS